MGQPLVVLLPPAALRSCLPLSAGGHPVPRHQPLLPSVWFPGAGTPRLPPHQTVNLDAPALLAAVGLKDYNGSVNLILDTKAQSGGLLMSTGSVDQKNTYVFEVMPHGVVEGAAKELCYWSTGNGDDTMVTLWNPADEPQDLSFTLFYTGGQYVYPIHLGPRETRTFNVSDVLHTSIPDAAGNVIPAGISEGSAEIAGSLGEQQQILVSLDVAVYNVRKATCGTVCWECDGIVYADIALSPFGVAVGGTTGETFYETSNTGYQYGASATWRSSATSIATVNTSGVVTGVSTGSLTLSADDLYQETEGVGWYCTDMYFYCPTSGFSASAPGTTTPTISQDKALWYFGSGIPTPSGFTLGATSATLTANGAGNGTYVWTITRGTLQVALENGNSSISKTNVNTVGISSVFESSAANDVTIQLQFTPSGGSQMTLNYNLSVDSPYKLTSTRGSVDLGLRLGSTCQSMTPGSDGYASGIPYNVISFFGVQITNIYVNETFGLRHDSTSNNWVGPSPGAFYSTDGTFADCLLAVVGPVGVPQSLPPQSPLLTQEILDITQAWYIGSQTSGSGLPVQFDSATYYQDHGRHLGVTSPVR